MILPKYPVYVVSKGRADSGHTAKFLLRDKVPFKIVVEPQEADAYGKAFGAENVLVLPFSNLGLGSIPARNWIWEHSKAAGFERHWILDDNIMGIWRRWKARKIRCEAGVAFRCAEDFTERYENVAISGLNYYMFSINKVTQPPFYLNVHVYSCLLILNSLPYRWRGRYNEDTDLCLQVLSGGWCTVLFNAFLCWKLTTMTVKGGNSAELYKGDGRLRMARSLERVWPHVVSIGRRFRRPQHIVRGAWRGFDTPLRLKPGVKLPDEPNEYGMGIVIRKPIESLEVRAMVRADAGQIPVWSGQEHLQDASPPAKQTPPNPSSKPAKRKKQRR